MKRLFIYPLLLVIGLAACEEQARPAVESQPAAVITHAGDTLHLLTPVELEVYKEHVNREALYYLLGKDTLE